MKIPAWLTNLTYKCLEKKPERRFKNGPELREYIHSGIIEEAVIKDLSISGASGIPLVSGDDLKLQKQVQLLRQQVDAKEKEVNELQDQLNLKDKELYEFKYSGANGYSSKRCIKTAFLTLLIVTLGLAAFAAYNLFLKKSFSKFDENTSMQTPGDSLLYTDTTTVIEDKPQKKRMTRWIVINL